MTLVSTLKLILVRGRKRRVYAQFWGCSDFCLDKPGKIIATCSVSVMTALCTANYRANCTAWLEMTKSGKFSFLDFVYCVYFLCMCICVCMCMCTIPGNLNNLRILPRYWNLKYQVIPAATTTVIIHSYPVSALTRKNFPPLSVQSLSMGKHLSSQMWLAGVCWRCSLWSMN